jgi:hypothetical protein
MGLFTNFFSSIGKHKNKKEFVVLIGLARFDAEVSGVKNHQDALEAICGPRLPTGIRRNETAWLIQDDKNPHDKSRVRVEIRGRQVGYLSPKTAAQYLEHLVSRGTPEADGQCQALIQDGWMSSDGRKGLYRVSLDIPSL